MSAGPDTREPRTRRALHALTGRHDVEYERAVPPRLDRTRQAAVHDCLFLGGDLDGWFATVLPDALTGLVDTARAAGSAAVAHTTGVGPAVRAIAAEAGAIGYARLPATFQALQPHHLREPDVLGAVVAAKRMLHRGPKMPVDRDVFDDVEQWAEACLLYTSDAADE